MKTPNLAAPASLGKASVADPIVAGNASNASVASNTGSPTAKFTIRLDPTLLGRIRAAYLKDLTHDGSHRSLSAWAVAHLEQAVAAAEARHNHGQPYEPVDRGVIPSGPLS